jgi:uncharacterized protein
VNFLRDFFAFLSKTLLVALLLQSGVFAQDVQKIPTLTGHVVDTTGLLDANQQAALEAKLDALEKAKGSQVVVLIVPTVQPEDISSYANRVGNAWKIGRKNVGDGVLFVIAFKDRQMRIEVAKTLEGAIPDLAAKQIITNAVTPRFKAGDYAGGISAGVDQLSARIKGEALPEVGAAGTTGNSGLPGGFDWMDLVFCRAHWWRYRKKYFWPKTRFTDYWRCCGYAGIYVHGEFNHRGFSGRGRFAVCTFFGFVWWLQRARRRFRSGWLWWRFWRRRIQRRRRWF